MFLHVKRIESSVKIVANAIYLFVMTMQKQLFLLFKLYSLIYETNKEKKTIIVFSVFTLLLLVPPCMV